MKHPAPSVFDIDLNHGQLKLRRTKIVATVGPASQSPEMLAKILRAGVDVIRVNFSHGKGEEHVKLMHLIRAVAKKVGVEVAILGDLCGPKVRVGLFQGDAVTLREGSTVTITVKDVLGTADLIPSQYRGIVKEAKVGARVLLDDGNLELRVVKKQGDSLLAKVLRGGVLKNKKGMNLPDTKMGIPALTEKDKADVLYCLRGGADFLALSFVRHAQDVRDLKLFLRKHGASLPIVSKIEKPEALVDIEAILRESDAIMVARGDLGVELPAMKVPHIQDKLIHLAQRCNRPVIVATQMLESMIDHSRPTRAEVTDVAAACRAGADAVMMSAETASGKYPLEAVESMDAVCRETEAYRFYDSGGDLRPARLAETVHESGVELADALGDAVALLSRRLMVHAVFALTQTGRTAQLVASDRPEAPILALVHDEKTLRRLRLVWGVYPRLVKNQIRMDEYMKAAEAIVKKEGLAKKGEYLLLLAGSDLGRSQGTNAIHVHRVG
ncbi:MAG: pyruvate kinase [Spirochaetes bacterium]|nr:pyruvate kinase [Spirochaetota bacterium]